MNVVTDGSAVTGGVVVAEHLELVTATGSHLCEEREKVVGHSLGVLSDKPRGMSTHGVEVA